jgi:uncharacterized membrane protein
MRWFLIGIGALHAAFMLLELFPWSFPKLLQKASERLPGEERWAATQRPLIAAIVHNAGIYNAVFAGGFFWAAWVGDSARNLAGFLFVGAAVAGIFGAVTLKSWATALQALLGIGGLAWLLASGPGF